MTEVDLKVLERIKKLHAMAESAREVGSLAEADSFMEAVEKTLAAHNMEMSMLSINLKDFNDPMDSTFVNATTSARHPKRRRERWSLTIADAVAKAHFCGYLPVHGWSQVFFCGRKSNVWVAQKMMEYLRDTALRLGIEAYLEEEQRRHREYGSANGAAQYKWNWFEGFADEVAHRYERMRAAINSDKGMSLVLVSVQKEADEETKKASIQKRSAPPKHSSYRDNDARSDGQDAARTVNLKPHSLDTTNTTAKRLNSGA